MCCYSIYKLTNLVNNKIYIGQTTTSINTRLGTHIHGKYAIGKAIRKYGIENFTIDVIVTNITNRLLLDELEIHYIQLYNSRDRRIGYNIKKGGNNYEVAESTKVKISKALTGRVFSITHKKNLSQKAKSRIYSEEYEKIRVTRFIEMTKSKVQKVNQYDLNMNLIKEWSSMKSVQQAGFNLTSLRLNLKLEKPYKQSLWKYVEKINV